MGSHLFQLTAPEFQVRAVWGLACPIAQGACWSATAALELPAARTPTPRIARYACLLLQSAEGDGYGAEAWNSTWIWSVCGCVCRMGRRALNRRERGGESIEKSRSSPSYPSPLTLLLYYRGQYDGEASDDSPLTLGRAGRARVPARLLSSWARPNFSLPFNARRSTSSK